MCFPKGLLLQVSIDFERVEILQDYIFSKIGTDLKKDLEKKQVEEIFSEMEQHVPGTPNNHFFMDVW